MILAVNSVTPGFTFISAGFNILYYYNINVKGKNKITFVKIARRSPSQSFS